MILSLSFSNYSARGVERGGEGLAIEMPHNLGRKESAYFSQSHGEDAGRAMGHVLNNSRRESKLDKFIRSSVCLTHDRILQTRIEKEGVDETKLPSSVENQQGIDFSESLGLSFGFIAKMRIVHVWLLTPKDRCSF